MKPTPEELAKRIYKGDLVEFRVVSTFPVHTFVIPPKGKFHWDRFAPKVAIKSGHTFTGIVAEKYRVSESRHCHPDTISVSSPAGTVYVSGKVQPGKKQTLIQHLEKYFIYHILLGDVLISLDSRQINKNFAPFVELTLLQRGDGWVSRWQRKT